MGKLNSLKRFKLTNEPDSMSRLNGVIKSAKILPVIKVRRTHLKRFDEFYRSKIQGLNSENLILRPVKDGDQKTSNAPKWIKNIPLIDPVSVEQAVVEVFESYGKRSNKDEAFFQPMVDDIVEFFSAVVISGSQEPYYYRIKCKTSSSIEWENIFFCFKDNPALEKNSKMARVVKCLDELGDLLGNQSYAIELALTQEDQLYLLGIDRVEEQGIEEQVSVPRQEFAHVLHKVRTFLQNHSAPQQSFFGQSIYFKRHSSSFLGAGLDSLPYPLSMSTYQQLIGQNTWSEKSEQYGYRGLNGHPWIVSLLGVPYTDMRVHIHSFIPHKLPIGLGAKVYSFFNKNLLQMGESNLWELTQKIDFCFYLGLPAKIKRLLHEGLSFQETELFENALKEITNNIIHPKNGLYLKELQKVNQLEQKLNSIHNSSYCLVDKIYWATKELKEYGAGPFIGMGRAKNVASRLLDSLVDRALITENQKQTMLRNFFTMGKRLNTDLLNLQKGQMTTDQFVARYGETKVRPLDFSSPRLQDCLANLMAKVKVLPSHPSSFAIPSDQQQRITQALKEDGLILDTKELFNFIRHSYEGWEKTKFLFEKGIGLIFKYVGELANQVGIACSDIPFLDISTLIDLHGKVDDRDLFEILNVNIQSNKQSVEVTRNCKWPTLITHPDNIFSFSEFFDRPTFVTDKKSKGRLIQENELGSTKIDSPIVLIHSADQVSDVLLTQKIECLITARGGKSSALAQKCSDLGVLAAIGVGENEFNHYCSSEVLEVDGRAKRIKVVK